MIDVLVRRDLVASLNIPAASRFRIPNRVMVYRGLTISQPLGFEACCFSLRIIPFSHVAHAQVITNGDVAAAAGDALALHCERLWNSLRNQRICRFRACGRINIGGPTGEPCHHLAANCTEPLGKEIAASAPKRAVGNPPRNVLACVEGVCPAISATRHAPYAGSGGNAGQAGLRRRADACPA